MPYGVIHDGQPVEITPGLAFTTHQIVIGTEEEAAWSMAPIGTVIDSEVSHPGNALEHYAPEDLARFRIQQFAEGAAPPAGHVLATRTLVVANGAISVAVTYALTPVPFEVSMMQAQLALAAAGKLAAVEAAVAAASATVQIYWRTAPTLHRDHPLVASLAAAVGLTSPEVDALFVAASAIT